MSHAHRVFRGPDSHAAEALSRDAIAPFLNSRGYHVIQDERIPAGNPVQQLVTTRAPDGQVLKMRVRLCWRRDGMKPHEKKYAAAQLCSKLRRGGWTETLEYLADRDRRHNITHNLLVQREGAEIIYAALIPVDQVGPVWRRQREVSYELQRSGGMGRIKKNHAENGSSPTIWLQDDRAPNSHLVAEALWQWPGVIDLAKVSPLTKAEDQDDTFDDCPTPDYLALGRDGGQKVEVVRSEVRRDPRVRQAVVERASACERAGCGEQRNFPGFLDVHHILGVEKSDRVYNCIALCPNCHREAHFAPYAEDLNRELLAFANQFLPQGQE